MIEKEGWYDDVYLRDPRGHYCVECQDMLSSDMDALTHLLRVHDWDGVDLHVDW